MLHTCLRTFHYNDAIETWTKGSIKKYSFIKLFRDYDDLRFKYALQNAAPQPMSLDNLELEKEHIPKIEIAFQFCKVMKFLMRC